MAAHNGGPGFKDNQKYEVERLKCGAEKTQLVIIAAKINIIFISFTLHK